MAWQRLVGTFTKSKLMGFTLTGFLLGYLVIGYVLFYQGLYHLSNLPAIGPILSERIFYLMFFFFLSDADLLKCGDQLHGAIPE